MKIVSTTSLGVITAVFLSHTVVAEEDKSFDAFTDNWFALSFAAMRYLPESSRASEPARSIFWCGTPVSTYVSRYGDMIPEKRLLERAKELQEEFAPEEIGEGPLITDADCETKGCKGLVSISRSVFVHGTKTERVTIQE